MRIKYEMIRNYLPKHFINIQINQLDTDTVIGII